MIEIQTQSVQRCVARTKDIHGKDIRSSDGTLMVVPVVVYDQMVYRAIDGIPQPSEYIARAPMW